MRVARDANALENTCAAMPGAAAEGEEQARSDRPEEKGRAGAAKANGRLRDGARRVGFGMASVDGVSVSSRRAPRARVDGGSSSKAW